MKLDRKNIIENTKTIFYALIIAIIIRSLFFQPFYIPSSSMEPSLLVGDRLFVTKYTYGYSKHSFPFSPNFSQNRFFFKEPTRGDVAVFKTPADNRTDYIKRLIGLPGDIVQFIDGDLYINNVQVIKTKISQPKEITYCGSETIQTNAYEEKLPNGVKYVAVYRTDGSYKDSDKYLVPANHYFFLGDNRDCSKDSRFLSSVGYVNKLNLVGRAKIIFFSTDIKKGRIFEFWNWNKIIRFDRFFSMIKYQ
jgi:signal peptidase I